MAWVAVDKNGNEVMFNTKPNRKEDVWFSEEDIYGKVVLSRSSVIKLLGKDLKWPNSVIEVKDRLNPIWIARESWDWKSGDIVVFNKRPQPQCSIGFETPCVVSFKAEGALYSKIYLPEGSIKKLIGRDLDWGNEPVELKEE